MGVFGLHGLPQPLFDAIGRAQARHADVSFAAIMVDEDGEEYSFLAAHGGLTAQETVPGCITNNHEIAAVLDHYFDELAKQVADA